MAVGRAIAKRLPACPGLDSRFSIKHHAGNGRWWVHYDGQPADDDHADLVDLVNDLKAQINAHPGGGAFSLNEHGQVIARLTAPEGGSAHIIGLEGATVASYTDAITFSGGVLDPRATPAEGAPWPGPLCGMSYKFAAPGNRKPPSGKMNEVFVEESGVVLQLSTSAWINPYPPPAGPLADFLAALRRLLPNGGRFRVNEHARAFTSNEKTYIGLVPLGAWFPPLTNKS